MSGEGAYLQWTLDLRLRTERIPPYPGASEREKTAMFAENQFEYWLRWEAIKRRAVQLPLAQHREYWSIVAQDRERLEMFK